MSLLFLHLNSADKHPTRPFYIETEFAWYILQLPSEAYQPHFEEFYAPRRIAQLVVSAAIKYPHRGHDAFIESFKTKLDIFGQNYTEEDLWRSVSFLSFLHSKFILFVKGSRNSRSYPRLRRTEEIEYRPDSAALAEGSPC